MMKEILDNIEKYKLCNNKATYYRYKRFSNVEYIEPSFIFELIYFNEMEMLEKEKEKCIIEKHKIIKRHSSLCIEDLEERLFRSLVNRDKYHTLSLSKELLLRDSKKFFDILYELSFNAEDENKLIKTYLFEIIYSEIGYNEYLLKNLIKYFISSYNKYMNLEDENQINYFYNKITELYIHIYNIKCSEYYKENLKVVSKQKMSEVKKIIYKHLTKEK